MPPEPALRSVSPRGILPDMLVALSNDASDRPELFRWRGPIEQKDLDVAIARLGAVPDELLTLLRETGGGDRFETEELLSPVAPDGVHDRTMWHAAHGSELEGVLFHEGLGLSYVMADGRVVVRLSDHSRRELASLDEWYRWLRDEFAERYGLQAAP